MLKNQLSHISKPDNTTSKVIERERVIERDRIVTEEAPKNQLRIIGGVLLQDLNDVETEKVENEEGEKQTNVNGLPDEDKLLYGFGYDRRMGILSVGGAYMRNKPRTNEVVTLNLGLNW